MSEQTVQPEDLIDQDQAPEADLAADELTEEPSELLREDVVDSEDPPSPSDQDVLEERTEASETSDTDPATDETEGAGGEEGEVFVTALI